MRDYAGERYMTITYEIHELAYEAEEELERSSTARAKCVLVS